MQVYIVSFWNSDSLTDGLHTVAFYTTTADTSVHIYNLSKGSTNVNIKNSFSAFVNSDRFIVGYSIPRLRDVA